MSRWAVERVKPVSSLLTVTFACGTTAPVESVTVPRMVAVIRWANDGAAIPATRTARQASVLRMDPSRS